MLRHVVRLATVALVATVAGLVVPLTAQPAQAAGCSTATGVSVVVDFHQLGGGVQSACDASGAGKYAAAQFTDVEHTLTYVQGQAFVCQVDGKGSAQCVRTPPADAYWSLWWSDGKSGTWTYASTGVTSLKVPAGGSVALSWQKGSGQVPPGVAPRKTASSTPSTKPSSHPTHTPTHQPSQSPSTTHGSPSAPASSTPTGPPAGSQQPSHSASGKPSRHASSSSPASSPSAASSDGTAVVAGGPSDTSPPGSGSGSGLPGWVAPAVVAVLFVAAGAVAVIRRKRTGGA